MQYLPHRLEENRSCYPAPGKPIERISEEELHRAAKAMREAWPEPRDTAVREPGPAPISARGSGPTTGKRI
ncbi:hypothetical protein GCM10011588_58670 [Nocardia jinanensis]|uniref:Uncharacterized protein n=1 Tax=Nocardia jinanensis TaxID=382504 RepID=A0A917RWJ2_9NOCA|nr:hypothetical protein GCM10011588_58670 [Nocardia jinanensis]